MKFNKAKSLLQLNFKKNRVHYFKMGSLIISIIILITSVIYLTYAKFSTSGNYKITNTTVNSFKAIDYTLAAYVDNVEVSSFPLKTSGYAVDHIDCTNGATATWNYETWSAITSNITSKTKCSVYFSSASGYADGSGASIPELYQGLIPVKYDASGNTIVADKTTEWYNYNNHNWANAVLVNCADQTIKDTYFNTDMSLKSSAIGTTIPNSSILQYYVWIPRYKYLLWNAENGFSTQRAITIAFEDKNATKSTGTINGRWLTHPAFTFGTTELNGIWVGKFETGGTTTNLTVKPNVSSIINTSLGDFFNASRQQDTTYYANYGLLSNQIDTHVSKNTEWGLITYFTNSIYGRYNDLNTCIASGCEVWNNPTSNNITGCAGDAKITNYSTNCNVWNSTLGVNASSTGNIYGIYDLSGGRWEYVMGTMKSSSGTFYQGSSGVVEPESKYYDSYTYGTATDDYSRHILGDATGEIMQMASPYGGWYNNYSSILAPAVEEGYWYMRGGCYLYNTTVEGIFSFYPYYDNAYAYGSFRLIMTAQ